MGRPHYICNACRRDFTRIWNANRHRLNQHHGLAEIMPIGEFLLRDKSRSNNYSEYSKLPRSIYDGFPLSRSNTVTYPDEDRQETFLTDMLVKLAPKVVELDLLLSSQYTTEVKEKVQGTYIIKAIASPDPIYHMDQLVKSVRRGITSGMMIKIAARSLGVPILHAERILQQFLSSSRRTRINRIVRNDPYHIYQRELGHDVYAFQSMPYNYHRQMTFTSQWINEGYRKYFY